MFQDHCSKALSTPWWDANAQAYLNTSACRKLLYCTAFVEEAAIAKSLPLNLTIAMNSNIVHHSSMQKDPQSSEKHKLQLLKLKSCLLLSPLILSLLLLLFLYFSSTSSVQPRVAGSTEPNPSGSGSRIPSFAFYISNTNRTSLFRLLLSVYHPKNTYLLHLDLGSSGQNEREELAREVRAVPVFRSVGNVNVIGKADFAYKGGSSALSALLHGAAVLLRVDANWDWFINLDVGDYPLVTQDDLLHVFSILPKDLNFVHHSNYVGWRESRKLRPIIVDPGLYLSSNAEMFYATQKRDLPNAYKIFTGSPSVILSRNFVEHCITGTENLPRILLMYYANTPASHTTYFQTLLCNSPEYNQTIVNSDMHYAKWDSPPKREPVILTLEDFDNMTEIGVPFATGFSKSSSEILDKIDREILKRDNGKIVEGGWCLGGGSGDRCTTWQAADVLKPGDGAKRLAKRIEKMVSDDGFRLNRCVWDGSM